MARIKWLHIIRSLVKTVVNPVQWLVWLQLTKFNKYKSWNPKARLCVVVTLKKSGPKYGPEKSRVQKTGSLLFKKAAPCFFQVHILNLIFQGYKPTHVFKTRIVGAD